VLGFFLHANAHAQETVCARVKIEIKQELTLERQAFDAEMKISNTLDSSSLSEVGVVVKITDEAGVPVAVTNDPDNLSAKFFVRVSSMDNIADVAGNGVVSPSTTAQINWLIIPAPGAAGLSPLGKKYLVGATLTYRFGGEVHTLDVSPDVITVKPLPLLTLDYFLTEDVVADDPLTPAIEAAEPFTLGVRVKNTGMATAANLKIDSAQPRIVENEQGLLINFKLTGSYVNDAPVQNTLLLNFGDIAANTSKVGRWIMETTLAGRFTEFSASFSHADELGGALTSILQATNAHFLIRDVRVDLPGRDLIRDFLAKDGEVIRVYESDGPDTVVTDLSGVAQLQVGASGYRLTAPATPGFIFVKLPDPYAGQKALGRVLRSDAKEMLPENVWLSRSKNPDTKEWDYWINFFDANSTGVYDAEFTQPPAVAQPPVIQFIPDRVVKEEEQVSFLVEASSPGNKTVNLSALPLPTGALFTQQAIEPQTPGLRRAVFDWTPPRGSAGNYLIVYTATDGELSSTRSATIRVDSIEPPPGPATPTVVAPLSGATVTTLRPLIVVQTGTAVGDPTAKVQFELYTDEAMTQLAANATVDRAGSVANPAPTGWQVANDLMDNTHYWWRARAYDGSQIYSAWTNGRFLVNLYNDAPDNFNLTNPAPAAEVASLTPTLSWTNALDRDGDVVTYTVEVYRDSALLDRAVMATGIPAGAGGTTSWVVDVPLSDDTTYYWFVTAFDAFDARTSSNMRPFTVRTANAPPSAPVIVAPLPGAHSQSTTTALTINNSVDADGDLITYVFEIDTVNTFDSGAKRASGQVIQGAGQTTAWLVDNLVENKRYFWRVKAQDGRVDSAWVNGDFLMNAVNDAPPTPTVKNPGSGSWVAVTQPGFEANPVVDPEGEAVRYEFEVYKDAALTQKVADGLSLSTNWIPPVALADLTTHWWRLRAMDVQGASSPWGAANVLYVSTAPYQNPSIQMLTPATPMVPEAVMVGAQLQKQVTLRWEGTNPNIDSNIALYFDTAPSGYAGTLIVDGIRQAAGTHQGTHVWDASALNPGTYYVYAVIYDAKGIGRAYAPGAVVIPPLQQSGQVVVEAAEPLQTNEAGGQASFSVRLGSAPTNDVVIPVSSTDLTEARVSPQSLVFTPANWGSPQVVTVTGQRDCVADGSSTYQILSGKLVSLDPNYIGLSGLPVAGVNADSAGNSRQVTNYTQLYICGLSVVAERQISSKIWEYDVKGELTNTGFDLTGVVATVTPPTGLQAPDNQLNFGAVAMGETVKSADTFTFRSPYKLPPTFFQSVLLRWTAAIQQ